MSYVLDAGRLGHGMDALGEALSSITRRSTSTRSPARGKAQVTFDCVAVDKAAEYAAEDADITLRLWQVLKPRLAAERMTTRLRDAGAPAGRRCWRAWSGAASRSTGRCCRGSPAISRSAPRALEAEIHELAGEPLNPGSPKQLGDILFGKIGLARRHQDQDRRNGRPARACSKSSPSRATSCRRKILDWRQVTKLKSTYTDALPGYVNPDTDRVHTSYALAATTTGRLSSSEPNLQNIPIRTEEGRKIRRAFIATPGNKLVSADYSQIELRLLAEIADVPALRQGVPRRRSTFMP